MPRKAATAILLLSLLGASACSPVNSFQGFQAIDHSPSEVKVGEDTRSTVLARLGSPTAVSTFDKDTWYYISQVTSRTAFYHPRVNKRDVVAIGFRKSDDQVVAVNTYTLKDGRVIAYNDRETPTRGREMSVLEQLLGSISAAGALPQPDVNPNSHGRQGGGP
jgi:outer membrane protein assembly factor BamE (lipoprotein component of BamABCDE complex)